MSDRLRTEQAIRPAIRYVRVPFVSRICSCNPVWIIELETSWYSDVPLGSKRLWHVNLPKCPPTVWVGLMDSASGRL